MIARWHDSGEILLLLTHSWAMNLTGCTCRMYYNKVIIASNNCIEMKKGGCLLVVVRRNLRIFRVRSILMMVALIMPHYAAFEESIRNLDNEK
jgi:hypothetical protein